MATNRTKIDWAYKQAEDIQTIFFEADGLNMQRDAVREVAAILRRAEKRGMKIESNRSVLTGALPKIRQYDEFEGLTAATIRKCKKQLEASEIKPNVDGNWTMRVLNPEAQTLTGRHKRMR